MRQWWLLLITAIKHTTSHNTRWVWQETILASYKTSTSKGAPCHKRDPEKSPPKSRSLSPSKSPLTLTQRIAEGRSEQFITPLLVVASHSRINSGRGNRRLRWRQHVIKYSSHYQCFKVTHRQWEQRLRSHQHTLSLICSCVFWLLLSCNISWIGKFLKSLLFSCSFDSILFYFSVHSSYLSPLVW